MTAFWSATWWQSVAAIGQVIGAGGAAFAAFYAWRAVKAAQATIAATTEAAARQSSVQITLDLMRVYASPEMYRHIQAFGIFASAADKAGVLPSVRREMAAPNFGAPFVRSSESEPDWYGLAAMLEGGGSIVRLKGMDVDHARRANEGRRALHAHFYAVHVAFQDRMITKDQLLALTHDAKGYRVWKNEALVCTRALEALHQADNRPFDRLEWPAQLIEQVGAID